MKRLVQVSVVTVLFLGLLIGCSSSTETTDRKNQLVLSSISPPKSFNPVTAKETSTTQITSLMFLGLTQVNGKTGDVEPDLAKSWESRKGGKVWEFTLRDDLKWSDGNDLTVEDVLFTYNDLYLNPKIETTARSMLFMDGNPPEVTKVGPRTVQFRYPEPYAPFARAATLAIMPEHVFGDHKPADFNSSLGVGTDPNTIVVNGPFRLGSYKTSQRVVLLPNPQYYREGENGEALPKLNKIIFQIIKNTEISVQRFLKGDLDAVGVQPRYFPLVKQQHDPDKFEILKPGHQLGTLMLTFNMNTDVNPETGETYIPEHKLDWFNDPNFRRAVSYGIDRSSIIEIVYNSLGTPQYGPVSPGNKIFHNPDLKEYPHDPEKARAILSENGYRDRDGDGIREDEDGNPIQFVLNTNSGNDQRVEMSEIIRQDLSDLGFDVNFNQVEFNTLVSKLNSDFDWEAVVMGFTGSLEPHFGSNLWKSSGDLHIWHPRQKTPKRDWEARIDQIFEQAVKETNRKKRVELYHEWQEIVNEKQPVIYTVTGKSLYAVQNYVKNMKPTAIGGMLHNVEEISVE